MTVGKAVYIVTSSEVSTAIAGSTYMCSGIATKIDSSFVDINWVRGDSSVGSTRYNITSQTFSINDINSKIEKGVDSVSASGTTISFARTHTTAPNVVATGSSGAGSFLMPVITGRTTTGFTVILKNENGIAVDGYINWIAVW